MFRRFFIVLVALFLLTNCKNSPKKDNSWEQVYKNAYTNRDYTTATVALNHLIITDSANRKEHYDSLVAYYFKRLNNFNAVKRIIDKALELDPQNPELMSVKSTVLMSDKKVDEARELYLKAHKVSGKNQYRYKYGSTFADENLPEYVRIANEILYDPKTKGEKIEVPMGDDYQDVDLRSLIFTDRVRLLASTGSTDMEAMLMYVDSALIITPDYKTALGMKDELMDNRNRVKPR